MKLLFTYFFTLINRKKRKKFSRKKTKKSFVEGKFVIWRLKGLLEYET